MLIIIFLLYMCYHFVLKIKQFFCYTLILNIFNYFQRNAYFELLMFWYYTLETKKFARVIENLRIDHVGYLFNQECNSRSVF